MFGDRDINCATKFQLNNDKSFLPVKIGNFIAASLQITNQSVWLVFTTSFVISNLGFVETTILKF